MLRVLCQWWKWLVELRLFVNDGNEEKHSSGSAKAPCQWQWRKNNYSFRSAQASGEAADRRRLLPLPRLCLSLSCCQCLIEGRAVNNVVAVSKVTAGWFQWQGIVSEINSLTLPLHRVSVVASAWWRAIISRKLLLLSRCLHLFCSQAILRTNDFRVDKR